MCWSLSMRQLGHQAVQGPATAQTRCLRPVSRGILCVCVSVCVSVNEGLCTGYWIGAVVPGVSFVQETASEWAETQWQLPDSLL